MTIKELIQELQKYPEDMTVLVEGYENGYDDVYHIVEADFIKKKRPMWYDGDYDKINNTDDTSNGHFKGLIIKTHDK